MYSKLKAHLKSLGTSRQKVFASSASTTVGYLRKVISTNGAIGPALAMRLESASSGAVMRWDLRPDDWHLIWPELVGTEGAPSITQSAPAPSPESPLTGEQP